MLYQLSYGGVWADCIKNSVLVKDFFVSFLIFYMICSYFLFALLKSRSMITILAVTDGFKHFGEAITEYGKRTQKVVNLKLIRPISHTNPEYIKVKETIAIMESLKKMK